jgi:hypothetical protein
MMEVVLLGCAAGMKGLCAPAALDIPPTASEGAAVPAGPGLVALPIAVYLIHRLLIWKQVSTQTDLELSSPTRSASRPKILRLTRQSFASGSWRFGGAVSGHRGPDPSGRWLSNPDRMEVDVSPAVESPAMQDKPPSFVADDEEE